jgi:hypothetical protein
VTGPSFVLGAGVRVRVAPPVLPRIEVARPSPNAAVLVPVAGPRGPKGDPAPSQDLDVFRELVDTAVTVHVLDPEPHPAYDDGPSLTILFENGLI